MSYSFTPSPLSITLISNSAKEKSEVLTLENNKDNVGYDGVPLLTSENIGNASLVDLVLQERFIELYQEGFRYHDIRRYLKGRERQSPQCYEGLNAMVVGPGFSEFNTRTRIAQPFNWNDRMYLLPIPQKDIYSNPQMEQAPGY